MDESAIQALKYRCIGPPRGGRVVAVAGHPTETPVFYFGACAGGVWKTEDAGTYWQNVSDGYFNSAPVGALAIAESDPNVIYAGMGETATRLDISWGDGVYRSSDGGRTWSHAGLEDTHHVGKIRLYELHLSIGQPAKSVRGAHPPQCPKGDLGILERGARVDDLRTEI